MLKQKIDKARRNSYCMLSSNCDEIISHINEWNKQAQRGQH